MRSLFALALALTLPLTASAVPLELTHQGRLLDSAGTALSGSHDVDVTLYDAPSGGNVLWSGTHTGVLFEDGFYSLVLGTTDALDASTFDGDAVYLAIAIDNGSELSPRQGITSVPYAIHASTARDVVGGIADVSEVRVGGGTVIDSDGNIPYSHLTGAPTTLSDLSCSDGELAQYTGSSWSCGTPAANDDASALTTGVLSPDVIPIGNTADQVAAGNHRHDIGDVDGTVPYSQLPVGQESGKVMPGDVTISDLGGLPLSGGTITGDLAVDGAFSAATLDLSGGLRVGDATTCNTNTAGTLRFGDNVLQVCADGDWQDLYREAVGSSEQSAGASCKSILDGNQGAPSGVYWLNPSGSKAYEAYCDMTSNGGGWTLVLKANGPEYEYHASIWDEDNVDNESSPDTSWSNAKYQAFNDLDATELLLKSEGGNSTQLELPDTKPMLAWFQGPTVRLTHVAGSPNANHLVNGRSPTICGAPFRLNTGRASDDFPVRIGGYWVYEWSCGYGADDLGEPTGAESAGFGLRDDVWTPHVYNKRGFGLRQAHDYNNAPGGGQVSVGGAIYVR